MTGGKIDNLFQLRVHLPGKAVQFGIAGILRQQMGFNDGFTLHLIGYYITGHKAYSQWRNFQYLLRQRQIAKLNSIVFWKIRGPPFTDDLANPAVSSHPKIMIGNGHFQFRQHLIVRLGGFHLIKGNQISIGRLRNTACNKQQACENDDYFNHG